MNTTETKTTLKEMLKLIKWEVNQQLVKDKLAKIDPKDSEHALSEVVFELLYKRGQISNELIWSLAWPDLLPFADEMEREGTVVFPIEDDGCI